MPNHVGGMGLDWPQPGIHTNAGTEIHVPHLEGDSIPSDPPAERTGVIPLEDLGDLKGKVGRGCSESVASSVQEVVATPHDTMDMPSSFTTDSRHIAACVTATAVHDPEGAELSTHRRHPLYLGGVEAGATGPPQRISAENEGYIYRSAFSQSSRCSSSIFGVSEIDD